MPSENVTFQVPVVPSPMIDPFILNSIMTANLLLGANGLCVFGIFANIISIQIFRHQGFQDGVNITLTALALSDIGALVTHIALNLINNPWMAETDLTILRNHLTPTAVYFHQYFVKVSGLVTSFTALERCLCVILPWKVKDIVTNRVAVATNVLIFVIMLTYLFPHFYCTYWGWKFVPLFNRTVPYLFFRSYRDQVFGISYYFTDLMIPYTTFVVLVVCSLIIVQKLKSSAKWRLLRSGSQSHCACIGQKERKAVVMLTVVSLIFIVCVTPNSALLTAMSVVRELKLDGTYGDISKLCYSCTSLLEAISCSVNIFVYYNMSTKYRKYLNAMFSLADKDTDFISKYFLKRCKDVRNS